MKTKYLLFVLPLVALCACNKEGVESNDYKVATITAVCPTSNDNTTTKTTFWEKEGVYTLLWWNNDKVKVQKAPMELSEPATENHYIPTGYTFSAPGLVDYATTATFVTDNPLPYDIEDGETYAVTYGAIESESTGVVYTVPNGTTNILNRRLQTYIRNNQIRAWNTSGTLGNNLGMALRVIPMFALIKEGVPGHSASNLTFSTVASIIKLNLTNNTGSSQTITSIRLTNNKVGYTEDVCGFYGMEFNPETLEITYPEENWITVHHNYDGITLSQADGSSVTLENGETQVFSFLVFGGVNHGTLTWKVMNGDTQIGSDITVTPGVLDPCKVYTKNASLN